MADSLAAYYTEELRGELAHLAAWLPQDKLQLGDLGLMDGNRFIRQSTVEVELGLSVGAVRVVAEKDLGYRSEGAVAVRVGGGGRGSDPAAVATDAGAEITVSFSKGNAILLDMVGCTSLEVEDQLTLGRSIRQAFAEERWDPRWCVITELVQAEATTVIISKGSEASIGFMADARAALGDSISLADASLSLKQVRSDGIGFQLVAASGATPLMRGLRLKKGWWSRNPKVEIEGMEAVRSEDPFGEEEDPLRCFDVLGLD